MTREDVLKLLSYDPLTGDFWWKKASRRAQTDRPAGSVDKRNHNRRIRVSGQTFLAHRLAFLIMEGALPPNEVDHIDRDRTNNRWANLRHATKRENGLNRKSTASSGFKGVYFNRGRYIAQIGDERRTRHLGSFATAAEARDAWLQAAKQRGEFFHPR